MKKTTISFVLLLSLILCACTNSSNQAGDSASVSETPDFPTFEASAELWANAIGESLNAGGIYNAFSSEPNILESESEVFGNIRCLSYSICDNADVMLYENRDNQQCYQFSMSIDWGKVDPASDEALLIGYYTGLLILAAEQDRITASEITEDLGLANTYDVNVYDDTIQTTESEHASYSYVTKDCISTFNVLAK